MQTSREKNQSINNRWLDSKVDNTQFSPRQPLYSCFKRNCHLHCSALESLFYPNISDSPTLVRFNSVALVCCIINSQAIGFYCRIQICKDRQFRRVFSCLLYVDITGMCQALLHIFTFWNARYCEQPPYKCTLNGDHELLKAEQTCSAGGKYRCNWGFLHQGTWKNCCKGYNKRCVLLKPALSQLTSYRRSWDRHSPLQESLSSWAS